MSNGTQEARSFLKDVLLQGWGAMDKRKLLWLFGWGQDRAGAWADLLAVWEDLGGDRKGLSGVESGNTVLLFTSAPSDAAKVASWAT